MAGSTRHLTLFLMKRGTDIDGAVREADSLERHELQVTLGSEAVLFTKVSHSKVPWWIEFLDPLARDDLKAPSSRTTGAVLVIRLARSGPYARTVAYTFGYGRHLLEPARLERDFGLFLSLNAVDPHSLRAFDARRQEDVVVNARVQASAGTELSSFGLDEYRDIFRSATGVTHSDSSEILGSSVRGSVGVTFDVPIEVEDLASRARKLLRLYRRDTYRESFPFVDRVRPVDAGETEQLDGRLGQALLARAEGQASGFRCLYLAIPDVVDLEQTEGFTFSSEYGSDPTVFTELSLEVYIETRKGRTHGVSVSRTRSDVVNRRGEGQVDHRLATVYRCLVAEMDLDGKTYQLVDGNWYVISANFATCIRTEIESIPLSPFVLPLIRSTEDEGQYNARLAASLQGICLDEKNVSIGGRTNRLEVCDVGLLDKNLIFSKKRSSSSTLSHLWFQATVSMQALLSDADYRQRVRNKITSLDSSFSDLAADGVKGSDFTVNYLILGVNSENPTARLPFFSQVALYQANRRLRSMGVPVSISGVETEAGSDSDG